MNFLSKPATEQFPSKISEGQKPSDVKIVVYALEEFLLNLRAEDVNQLYGFPFGSNVITTEYKALRMQIFQLLEKLKAGNSAMPVLTGLYGRWRVRVLNEQGATIFIEIFDNGRFEIVRIVGGYQIPAFGTWSLDVKQHTLLLEGKVPVSEPFSIVFMITSLMVEEFMTIGNDGFAYQWTRQ